MSGERDGVAARLHIDWTRCQARGGCIELLAGRLEADDWGYPIAPGLAPRDQSNVPLRRDEVDAGRDAVTLCPRLALSLRLTPRGERQEPGKRRHRL